jgi:hypothetical protein
LHGVFKTGSLKIEHGRNKTYCRGDKTVVFKGNSQRPFNYECLVYNDKKENWGLITLK